MLCLNCSKETKSKFCGSSCQGEFRTNEIIRLWLLGEDIGYTKGFRIKKPIRKYMLEKVNFQCMECGWDRKNPITNTCLLEINHIDGDCSNCKEENLQVICPNCHSLTSNWKALNVGKGNKDRHRYSRLI